MGRAEIIGAILSVILIWFLTGILLWEAIRRTQEIVNHTRKSVVDGKIMFIVASFGLVANCTLLLVLGHDHGGHGHSHGGGGGHGHSHGGGGDHGHSHGGGGGGHGHSHGGGGHGHAHGENSNNEAVANKKPTENINVSAAYIHALGDLIQSVGVCIAGGLIWYFPGTEDKYYYWQLADPITTFLFSILVLFSTYGIIKTSLVVLMEGVPEGINALEIYNALLEVPDIITVHHLHIWAISLGDTSLSVHIVCKKDSRSTTDEILRLAQHIIRRFDIYHSTIQVELEGGDVCKPKDCVGTPCDSYALACDDDKSNCYEHTNPKNKENGNGSYGSF